MQKEERLIFLMETVNLKVRFIFILKFTPSSEILSYFLEKDSSINDEFFSILSKPLS